MKRYRCFDIGRDHYYYDDYENERSITEIAERSYIPSLTTLIDMAKSNNGAFKVALSLSGVGLEQLEIYAPRVIELLHELNETGCCEFLCEPYSHGLSALANEECFREDVERMKQKIKQMQHLSRQVTSFNYKHQTNKVAPVLTKHFGIVNRRVSMPTSPYR